MPDYKEEVLPKYRPIKENFPDIYDQIIISDSLRAGKRLLYLKNGNIAIYDYVDKTMTVYKKEK